MVLLNVHAPNMEHTINNLELQSVLQWYLFNNKKVWAYIYNEFTTLYLAEKNIFELWKDIQQTLYNSQLIEIISQTKFFSALWFYGPTN